MKAEFENLPLFTGYLATLMKRAVKRRDRDWAYSLLQCKRMWPQLGLERAAESLQDHQNLMVALPSPLSSETKHWLDLAVTSFLKFAPEPAWTKSSPSISGHYGGTSKQLGALGVLRKYAPEVGVDLDSSAVLGAKSLKELWRGGESEKASLYEVASRMLPTEDELRARVVLVPEPAKFRIVTCGDPFLYTYVQPLQSELLKAWALHPCSTMRVPDLGAYMAEWPRREYFVSGDYKSATDLLNVNASRYVLEQICMRWHVPIKLAEAAMLTLSGTTLQYPVDVTLAEESVVQTNGQLMGSPLSFPLLCIINLSTWLQATSDRRCRGRLPVIYDALINGDDIGFPASRKEYERWKTAANSVGFQLSLGKSYLSREIALINSQLYTYPLFKRVGYLNLKLCKGSSLKAGHSDAWDYQVGRAVNLMCELSPWTIPFIPMAMKSATNFLPGSNWYLPVECGGCGVWPGFAPDDLEVTRWQQKLAGASRMDRTLRIGLSAAVPGLGRALRLLGRPKEFSMTFSERIENDFWVDLDDREAAWVSWFQKVIGYVSLVGRLPEERAEEEVSAARSLARSTAIRRWTEAAEKASPMSLLKLFDPRNPDLYPFVPPLAPAWALH